MREQIEREQFMLRFSQGMAIEGAGKIDSLMRDGGIA